MHHIHLKQHTQKEVLNIFHHSCSRIGFPISINDTTFSLVYLFSFLPLTYYLNENILVLNTNQNIFSTADTLQEFPITILINSNTCTCPCISWPLVCLLIQITHIHIPHTHAYTIFTHHTKMSPPMDGSFQYIQFQFKCLWESLL